MAGRCRAASALRGPRRTAAPAPAGRAAPAPAQPAAGRDGPSFPPAPAQEGGEPSKGRIVSGFSVAQALAMLLNGAEPGSDSAAQLAVRMLRPAAAGRATGHVGGGRSPGCCKQRAGSLRRTPASPASPLALALAGLAGPWAAAALLVNLRAALLPVCRPGWGLSCPWTLSTPRSSSWPRR